MSADLNKAQSVYRTICRSLDEKDFRYDRHDGDLVLTLDVRSDGLSVRFLLFVRPETEIVTLYVSLPFEVGEEKRVELAVAVAVANHGMLHGSFDYDIDEGKIRFRVTQSYACGFDDEVVMYMLTLASHMTKRYAEKFLALSKGTIDLNRFIELEKDK